MAEPPSNSPASAEQSHPLILIPVTAEDEARRKRKILIKWLAGALVIAVIGFLIYRRATDPLRAKEAYDAGVRLYKATRYEEAILNFDRALDLMSRFPDAYRMRARSYTALYKPELAIPDFTKITELDPKDASAYAERGSAYLDQKDYTRAIADATKAITLDPKSARAYNLRGTALRYTGEANRAIEDFTHAIELQPNLDNYFQRGATYQLLNQHKLAIADFSQAIEIDPSEPHMRYARAQSLAAIGEAAAAQQDIQVGRKIEGIN